MKTQEDYIKTIENIVNSDVYYHTNDWYENDKKVFMNPENKDKSFILATRPTGCDLLMIYGTNFDENTMNRLFGHIENFNFYVCMPMSPIEKDRDIARVSPLAAFKLACEGFEERGVQVYFSRGKCCLKSVNR